jgi:hypothetical protein
MPRPAKAVHHVKRHVTPVKDSVLFTHNNVYDDGICIDDNSITSLVSPAAWVCERFGADTVKDYILGSTPANLNSFTFSSPDWFSIVSEFNESVDSLIPSSFFAGESMAESSIYKDALLAVIRPKRTIQRFFRDVERRGLRRHNLGEIHSHYRRLAKGPKSLSGYSNYDDISTISHYVKEGINGHLLYKFGVRPALHDLVSVFKSHASVDKRLRFLSDNAGQYVPIRIRKKLDVSFDDGFTATPFVDMVVRQSAQHTIATMFAMGRIRSDINDASKWRAYTEYFGLNKIVGTAWELIPFSFVIDWFTNAQERINELTRVRLGEGPFYNLVGVGSSIKNVCNFELLVTPGYDTTYAMDLITPESPLTAFNVEVSEYTRRSGLPDTSGVVDVSTLGLFHGVTGLELLLQKIL